MKKHLVLLCGVFYPNPSPTGLCAKRFAEILLEDFDIDVLCISENGESEAITLQNGIRVHTLTGKRISAEKKSTGLKKKLFHALGGIQIKTMPLGNLSWFRAKAYQELTLIQKQHPIDAVFSVCSPFAAHCAAMDFKASHKDIRWCAYTVDPYSSDNRIRPFLYSLNKLKAFERNVLSRSDSLLLSDEVYQARGELFSGHGNCKQLPYMLPEFEMKESQKTIFQPDSINCVYAGSFYADIRNPERMLQIFSSLSGSGIKLHLFSKGCEATVAKYASQSENIIIHPIVRYSEIMEVYRAADVLVGVGNTISDFLPSKVFEYISVCKPIVFFNSDTATNDILNSYPCQWQTTTANQIEADIESLTSFINRHGGDKVSASDVEKIYARHSVASVSQIIQNALKTQC